MDWDEETGEEHTPENPYCSDMSCWCHTDLDYHESVEYPEYSQEEIDRAYDFFDLSH